MGKRGPKLGTEYKRSKEDTELRRAWREVQRLYRAHQRELQKILQESEM